MDSSDTQFWNKLAFFVLTANEKDNEVRYWEDADWFDASESLDAVVHDDVPILTGEDLWIARSGHYLKFLFCWCFTNIVKVCSISVSFSVSWDPHAWHAAHLTVSVSLCSSQSNSWGEVEGPWRPPSWLKKHFMGPRLRRGGCRKERNKMPSSLTRGH